MSIYKEIPRADGSGVTGFFRVNPEFDTVIVGSGDAETVTSYKSLTDLPSINGVVLIDNRSLGDLGINIPTKLSDLDNDEMFVSSDTQNLLYYYTKTVMDNRINTLEATKVTVVPGKGLSTNDYTTEEKSKLSSISSGADENVITSISCNGVPLDIVEKNVNVSVPVRVSQLENDANYAPLNTQSLNYYDLSTTVDQKISSSLSSGLATKVDKITGKGLSTNDYTTAEKTKLAGITAGAEPNVNADWTATTGDAVILHKPDIPDDISDLNDSHNLLFDKDYDNLTHTPSTIINGVQVKNYSIYAPTTSGAAGTFLQSTGPNGAPVWVTIQGGGCSGFLPTLLLNGSVNTAPNFYAPLNGGRLGQVLTSQGPNSAPLWMDNGGVDLSNYLAKDNVLSYTPTGNYNPSTKLYVDDSISTLNTTLRAVITALPDILSGTTTPASSLGSNGDLYVLYE